MFAVRAAIVCLAFFAVMYIMLSSLVACGWSALGRGQRRKALDAAGFLFGLRIFPIAVSILFAIFLTLPSFWLMERWSFDEDGMTFLLAVCTLLLLTAGMARVLRAAWRTRQSVTNWLRNSGSDKDASVRAMRSADGAPAVILVGVFRPQIMVSDIAAAVLSEEELRVAIRHELGHQRSRDNLKKALINAMPFPGMSSMEAAWRQAAELAADDEAVKDRQDALDLASALIKLSRSSQRWPEPELASGLVCDSSAIRLRVQRLLQWREAGRSFRRSWPWATLFLLTVVGIASNYRATLLLTHRITELLVP